VLHVLDAACVRPTEDGRRVRSFLAALRAQQVQTVHLCAADPDGAPASGGWVNDAFPFYRTPVPCLPAWVPRPCRDAATGAALALRLRRIAHLTRPDLVHVHAPVTHACAAWPVARMRGLPFVVDAERRAAGTGAPLLARLACARADVLAAPSADVEAALQASGMRPRRIAIVPPAAADAVFSCVAAKPLEMIDAPLLAFAGDLTPAGGIDLLLSALAELRRRRRAIRLLVAGGGAPHDRLDARIAAWGLKGYVHVTGRLAGRRAADVLTQADVAVFPALPGAPAPSRHLPEAMARGCAVVASDIACHRAMFEHGKTGVLFPAASRSALVHVLAQLFDHTHRLRALGLAAARSVAAARDWPATAVRYRQLYEAVLTDTGRC
jgi:glycosyltransferase involved in cell wall biosynthesis